MGNPEKGWGRRMYIMVRYIKNTIVFYKNAWGIGVSGSGTQQFLGIA
jgi:hypothetical protein